LLWANWPPVHNLPDAETVARLSDIISSPAVVPPRIVRALAIARMEDHPMPLLDEQLSSHQAKSGR
jgi:hypothetical protein